MERFTARKVVRDVILDLISLNPGYMYFPWRRPPHGPDLCETQRYAVAEPRTPKSRYKKPEIHENNRINHLNSIGDVQKLHDSSVLPDTGVADGSIRRKKIL